MLLEQISSDTKLSVKYLENVARRADYLYKTYKIEKRSGGHRTIEHPSPRLKIMQRWIARHLIAKMPVHPAATAYRRGSSIADNAAAHANSRFLLHMDFADFFHSLRADDVRALFLRNTDRMPPISAEEISLVISILCRHGRLTIGAPSSPALSNALMFEFDLFWFAEAEKRGVVYTRYADDLNFSTSRPEVLQLLAAEIAQRSEQPGGLQLRINPRKTQHRSKKNHRRVTGLVITTAGKISLGRSKKREIRSLVYLAQKSMDNSDIDRIRGLLAYANSVEPSFVSSLTRKFGDLNRMFRHGASDSDDEKADT